MPHKDPEARRRYNTEYRNRRYREDPAFRAARLAARAAQKRELRRWLNEYKATLCCSRCAENHPACLDFHHLDPHTKVDGITELIKRIVSKQRILDEIAKCEVICANCHRKEHYAPLV